MQRQNSSCDEQNPTNKKVLDFMRAHIQEARILARQLNVPVENILGLSGEESNHGTSNIAANAHNFFGIHAGAPGGIGTFTTSKNAKVAMFPADIGFLKSGQSFIDSWGSKVRGKTDARAFAQALVPSFNTAEARSGGNPDFVKLVTKTINGVKGRLACLK